MPRNSNSFLDFLYTPFIISSRAHTNKSRDVYIEYHRLFPHLFFYRMLLFFLFFLSIV